jgi:soluble lytic murein transglycosylase
MPRVPTLDAPTVAPSQGVQNNFQPTLSAEAATVSGRQLQQQGQTLEKAGSAFGDMYLKAAEQANRVRALEAVNQAREAVLTLTLDQKKGFSNLKGKTAVFRDSGMNLSDEYGGMLDEEITKISEGLTNPQQRELFAQEATSLSMGFRESAQKHFLTEFNTYTKSVYEGAVALAAQEIALNPSDIAKVDANIGKIEAAVAEVGRMSSLSANQIQIATLNATSGAHLDAINGAIEREQFEFANKYFEKYKGQINADDQLSLTGKLEEGTSLGRAQEVAKGAMDGTLIGAAPVQANYSQLAFDVLVGTESGNRQFDKNGKPLTSSAGAVGKAQVMPGTGPEAAALANERWDADRWATDGAYNYKIGQAYFNKQLRDFGNVDMAWAAYNGGPGRLRKAIAASKKAGDGDWLSRMPLETRNYVAKNRKDLAKRTGGQTSANTFELVPLQETIDRGIEAYRVKYGEPSPKQVQVIEAEVTKRWTRADAERTAKNEAAVGRAQAELVANGGRPDLLPPGVMSAVPAKDVPAVVNYGKNIRDVTRENNPDLPAIMSRLNDDAYLAGLTRNALERFRPQIPEDKFDQVEKRYYALQNAGTTANGNLTVVPTDYVNSNLSSRLAQMGIDPKDKKNATRIGIIQMVVNDAIVEKQKLEKRQLGRDEIGSLIDRFGATTYTTDQVGFFGGRSVGVNRTRLFAVVKDNIPATTRARITADLQRRNPRGAVVEDYDVLEQFWREQLGMFSAPKKR